MAIILNYEEENQHAITMGTEEYLHASLQFSHHIPHQISFAEPVVNTSSQPGSLLVEVPTLSVIELSWFVTAVAMALYGPPPTVRKHCCIF